MEELKEFLDKYNVKYTVEGDTVIAGDINLSNKGISKLPESIGNLKCNELNLEENRIKELPESFSNIKCNMLWLSYNFLSEIPKYNKYKFDKIDLYNNINK